jgi:hypothetical protein
MPKKRSRLSLVERNQRISEGLRLAWNRRKRQAALAAAATKTEEGPDAKSATQIKDGTSP